MHLCVGVGVIGTMYLYRGVGVIGSIYLCIEGWALLVQYTCT